MGAVAVIRRRLLITAYKIPDSHLAVGLRAEPDRRRGSAVYLGQTLGQGLTYSGPRCGLLGRLCDSF